MIVDCPCGISSRQAARLRYCECAMPAARRVHKAAGRSHAHRSRHVARLCMHLRHVSYRSLSALHGVHSSGTTTTHASLCMRLVYKDGKRTFGCNEGQLPQCSYRPFPLDYFSCIPTCSTWYDGHHGIFRVDSVKRLQSARTFKGP